MSAAWLVMLADLDQQTLRLAIERLEGELALVRDMQARRGKPWSLEFALEVSVALEKLKGLVLH